MDRASQVLAQGVPPGVPKSYRTLADHSNIPHSMIWHDPAATRVVIAIKYYNQT
ncbi:hypothetical protein BGZ57DRAFT_913446 [Hyaloscypha finlandica]|nr:hypothetical protein BGZ57DRAFT_913446 [Hyaloscypha finlandica]